MGVFQYTAVGISTGLGHQWEADCHVAFAFGEFSVPAPCGGAISAQTQRARRLRSGMKVLWRRDCKGDCRSWRIATCRFDAVAHNSAT